MVSNLNIHRNQLKTHFLTSWLSDQSKDWDDSNTTPGLSDVGARDGALHDGGLAKSGSWKEVPLFTKRDEIITIATISADFINSNLSE